MKIFIGLHILLLLSGSLSTQPLFEIQANSEGQSQLRFRSNAEGQNFDLRMNNDGILRFLANGNSGNEVMQINDDTENVGIGFDATENTRLYVFNNVTSADSKYGIFSTASAAGGGSRFGVLGSASTSGGNLYGVYGSAPEGNGRWGVYCNGDFWYSGEMTMASDRRLKSNIRSLDEALEKVMKIQPRRYTHKYRTEGISLSQGPQIGFIAQELEKTLPELVATNTHDILDPSDHESVNQVEIKGINYLGLIPILTRAIQEQQHLIDSQNELIAQLEIRIKAIEDSISSQGN